MQGLRAVMRIATKRPSAHIARPLTIVGAERRPAARSLGMNYQTLQLTWADSLSVDAVLILCRGGALVGFLNHITNLQRQRAA
jgi:hypothetical protein